MLNGLPAPYRSTPTKPLEAKRVLNQERKGRILTLTLSDPFSDRVSNVEKLSIFVQQIHLFICFCSLDSEAQG